MSTVAVELASFEDARKQFADAIDGVPTAALTFLSPGDDYALGGLVTHVNAILRRYGRVLDIILAHPTSELDARSIDADADAENAHAIEGLSAANRDGAMATLAELHDHVAERLAVADAGSWDRKTLVVFAGSGGRPHLTSPADVKAWLTDHYLEHVPHVAELLEGWRAAQG